MSFDFDRFLIRVVDTAAVLVFVAMATVILIGLCERIAHAETLQCGVQEFESTDTDTLCQSVAFLQEGYADLSKQYERVLNDIWALEDRLTLSQYRWTLKPKRLVRILRHIRKGEAWAKPEC